MYSHTELHHDGSSSVAQMNEDRVKHGTYAEYWDDGKVKTKGRFRKGEKEGRWRYYRRDGTILLTNRFKRDKKEGFSTSFWENSTTKCSRLSYSKNWLHGWCYYWDQKGKLQLKRRYDKKILVEVEELVTKEEYQATLDEIPAHETSTNWWGISLQDWHVVNQ